MWKNVHPVYGTGIRTHDLWNMSLLPFPLDQGSRPTVPNITNIFASQGYILFYVHFCSFQAIFVRLKIVSFSKDSNLDHQSRRWPLDHHHGTCWEPCHKMCVSLCTVWFLAIYLKLASKRSAFALDRIRGSVFYEQVKKFNRISKHFYWQSWVFIPFCNPIVGPFACNLWVQMKPNRLGKYETFEPSKQNFSYCPQNIEKNWLFSADYFFVPSQCEWKHEVTKTLGRL